MKIILVLTLTLSVFSLPARASTLEERKACVHKLCGPMPQVLNFRGGGSFETSRPPGAVALIEKIQPVMNQILALNTDLYRDNLKAFERAETILNGENLNYNDLVLLGLSAYGMLPWSEVKSAAFVTNDGIKWNRAKLAALWPELSTEEIEWAANAAEHYAGSSYLKAGASIDGRSVGHMLESMDIKPEDYVAFVDNLLQVAGQQREWFGPIFVPDRYVDALKRARDNKKLNASEQAAFVKATANIIRWNELSAGPLRPIFASYPGSLNKFFGLVRVKWAKVAKRIAAAGDVGTMQTATAGQCSNKIAARFNTSPTAEDLMKFNGTAEAVRKAALQTLPAYLSGQALKLARGAVIKARFFNPPTRQEAGESMLHVFKTELRESQKVSEMTAKSKLIRFMLDVSLQADDDPIAEVLFNSLSRVCDEVAPPAILDAAIKSSGSVTIGWQSVKWPAYGAGLIAHELGHLAHTADEVLAALEGVHTCQIQQHKTIYGAALSPAGLTQEEDWADTFSISVQKRLQKAWPHTQNTGCLFLDMDLNQNSFAKDFPDLELDADNSHSTGFFRLLHQQIGRGKLPPVCSGLSELKNKTLSSCSK